MCGIVGLHVKDPGLEPELGRLIVPMLDCMGTRGPDSTGIAIYHPPLPEGQHRYSIRLDDQPAGGLEDDVEALLAELSQATGGAARCERVRADGAVVVASGDPSALAGELRRLRPSAVVMGYGRALEIVKDVGTPAQVCRRFDIARTSGYQAIGHTRMATESAVTIDHSHPFATNRDLAVVHNGSFSNPSTVRRRLQDEGVTFVTDNDTEVAARLIGRELSHGADLQSAIKEVENTMDGFFTLLVATDTEFAVVRDSFACKPLVVAETDAYVAVTSEYIAMAGLPGIESAQVFEPKPEEIHAWTR